eukprot:5170419-Amphidinium_carterae.1
MAAGRQQHLKRLAPTTPVALPRKGYLGKLRRVTVLLGLHHEGQYCPPLSLLLLQLESYKSCQASTKHLRRTHREGTPRGMARLF